MYFSINVLKLFKNDIRTLFYSYLFIFLLKIANILEHICPVKSLGKCHLLRSYSIHPIKFIVPETNIFSNKRYKRIKKWYSYLVSFGSAPFRSQWTNILEHFPHVNRSDSCLIFRCEWHRKKNRFWETSKKYVWEKEGLFLGFFQQ